MRWLWQAHLLCCAQLSSCSVPCLLQLLLEVSAGIQLLLQ
jgi:hypothetical protein